MKVTQTGARFLIILLWLVTTAQNGGCGLPGCGYKSDPIAPPVAECPAISLSGEVGTSKILSRASLGDCATATMVEFVTTSKDIVSRQIIQARDSPDGFEVTFGQILVSWLGYRVLEKNDYYRYGSLAARIYTVARVVNAPGGEVRVEHDPSANCEAGMTCYEFTESGLSVFTAIPAEGYAVRGWDCRGQDGTIITSDEQAVALPMDQSYVCEPIFVPDNMAACAQPVEIPTVEVYQNEQKLSESNETFLIDALQPIELKITNHQRAQRPVYSLWLDGVRTGSDFHSDSTRLDVGTIACGTLVTIRVDACDSTNEWTRYFEC